MREIISCSDNKSSLEQFIKPWAIHHATILHLEMAPVHAVQIRRAMYSLVPVPSSVS